MNQKEKSLLLKDLCARLPYGVICTDSRHGDSKITEIDTVSEVVYFDDVDEYVEIKNCKPYLRSMSSMTEEEKREYDNFLFDNLEREDVIGYEDKPYGVDVIMRYRSWEVVQWLLEHHLDFNGLIDVYGLALEAPKGMYN